MDLQPESHAARHRGADAGHRHCGPAGGAADGERGESAPIEFVRRKNAALTDTVRFANSPAAASFQPAGNAPTITTIDANWDRVIVEDSVTTGDQAIRFGRVLV